MTHSPTSERSRRVAHVRAASFNFLGAHHTRPGGKNANLPSGYERTKAALRLFEKQGISVVGGQEYEDEQARAVREDRHWGQHRARRNNRYRDGNSGGNVVVWDKRVWKMVRRGSRRLPYYRDLWFADVTLEHRETGERYRVIGAHLPSAGDGAAGVAGRARGQRLLCELGTGSAERGRPALVLVDANDGDVDWGEGSSAVHEGPDWVIGYGVHFYDREVVRTRGAISDHDLVSAEFRSVAA